MITLQVDPHHFTQDLCEVVYMAMQQTVFMSTRYLKSALLC